MTGELPITLNFVGKKPLLPLTINANPELLVKGELIKIEGEPADYIVESKQLIIARTTASVTVDVKLKSNRKWFEGFDEFAGRYDVILGFLGVFFLIAALFPIVVLFLFLAMTPQDKLAYAGYAITFAPLALVLATFVGACILSNRLESRVGWALSFAFGTAGVMLGVIMGILWSYLFIPEPPTVWPADYIELATRFWQSTSSMVAVSAVYAPLIFLITKLLKLDVIGTIASAVFEPKKRG